MQYTMSHHHHHHVPVNYHFPCTCCTFYLYSANFAAFSFSCFSASYSSVLFHCSYFCSSPNSACCCFCYISLLFFSTPSPSFPSISNACSFHTAFPVTYHALVALDLLFSTPILLPIHMLFLLLLLVNISPFLAAPAPPSVLTIFPAPKIKIKILSSPF